MEDGITIWSATRGQPLDSVPAENEVIWVAMIGGDGFEPERTADRIRLSLGLRVPPTEAVRYVAEAVPVGAFGILRGREDDELRAVHAFRAGGEDGGEGFARSIQIEPVSLVAPKNERFVLSYSRKPYLLSSSKLAGRLPCFPDKRFLGRTKRRWTEDLNRAAQAGEGVLQAPDLATIILYGLVRSFTDVRRCLRRWLETSEVMRAGELSRDPTAIDRYADDLGGDLNDLRLLTLQFSNAIRALKAPAEYESESWFRGFTRGAQRAVEADQKLDAALVDLGGLGVDSGVARDRRRDTCADPEPASS